MSISYHEAEMVGQGPDTMFNLSHCYNSENYLTEVDHEETSALYEALGSLQEDYSEVLTILLI